MQRPQDDTILTTDRLVIRHWRDADAPGVLAMFGDPDVARWTSRPEPLQDLDQARQRIEDWRSLCDDDRGFGFWAVVPEGAEQPVGVVLVRPMAPVDGVPVDDVEIGWTLAASAHGNGYATEAARGLLEHARRHGHRRLRAIMWPDNAPSAAVCRRLGMQELGVVDDPWHGTDEFPTSLMFLLELP